MAKRYTDTDIFKKHFTRGLQGAYKLFWIYLYHACDHAGIWIADFEIAQIFLGKDMQINKKDALKYFNNGEERIIEVNNGGQWFIPSFIEFQYGELNEDNRVHKSILQILRKYKLVDNKGHVRGLQACKDKDKDKNKEQDKESFEIFWNLYDYKTDRKKCEIKWGYVKKSDHEKIFEHVKKYVQATPDKKYRKHPLTYLNGECWNDEVEVELSPRERVAEQERRRQENL